MVHTKNGNPNPTYKIVRGSVNGNGATGAITQQQQGQPVKPTRLEPQQQKQQRETLPLDPISAFCFGFGRDTK